MTTYLLDANLWIALAVDEHTHHSSTHDWFQTIEEPGSVLFCRTTQHSFLRLLTNAAVFSPYGLPPLTNDKAWETYEEILEDGRVDFLAQEPAGIEKAWREFSSRRTASLKLWTDAYLAAFAKTGGHRFVTLDASFRQFSELDLLLLA